MGFELVTHQTLQSDGRTSHVFAFRKVGEIDQSSPIIVRPLQMRQDIIFDKKSPSRSTFDENSPSVLCTTAATTAVAVEEESTSLKSP